MKAILTLLLAAATVFAVPPAITVPKEVKGKAGQFVRLDATTEGKQVRWFALDGDISVFPSELLKDSKTTVVVAITPGQFRVMAITCAGDELSDPAITYVTIEGKEPVPPAPPTPPTPPVDSFSSDLQVLYAQDTDPKKKEYAESMSGFYRQMAVACSSPSITTTGQLYDAQKRASAGLIPKGALLGVTSRVGQELKRVLGANDDAALTATTRADAAVVCQKASTVLGGLSR